MSYDFPVVMNYFPRVMTYDCSNSADRDTLAAGDGTT